MVTMLKATEYGKLISGRNRTMTSSPTKEALWTPKNLQDSCIYIEIGVLGLLQPTYQIPCIGNSPKYKYMASQGERHHCLPQIHCKLRVQGRGRGQRRSSQREGHLGKRKKREKAGSRGSADPTPPASRGLIEFIFCRVLRRVHLDDYASSS